MSPFVLLFVASLSLRLLNLGHRDLTLDEAWSYFLVLDYGLQDILSPFTEILYNDVHPPLFYVICKLWQMAGYDAFFYFTGDLEFTFRFPFAVINAAVAPILFSIGRRISGARLGWTLGVLHIVNSYSIQMVHQTRMYPLVELLAVICILGYIAYLERQEGWSLWALAACSTLMLLSHYACFFFLVVLWGLVFHTGRRQWLRVLTALILAVLGFAWWSPALLHQLQTESAAASSVGSTGLIIPYTLYQFLLGDRSLSYGSLALSGLNLWTAAVFGLVAVYAVFHAWREQDGLRPVAGIGLLGIGSIGLLWIGTFFIPRVFYATFYAIFSLPAILVFVGTILVLAQSLKARIGSVVLLLIVATNVATLTSFYRNTLYPYEPWKEACRQLRIRHLDRVAVYAPHMKVLIQLYGAGLQAVPLPYECSTWSPQPGACEEEKTTALVISHDSGHGKCYAKKFSQCFGPHREDLSLHGIEITFFGGGS